MNLKEDIIVFPLVLDVYKEALTKNLGNHSLIIENNHLKTNDTLDLLNSILLDFLPE